MTEDGKHANVRKALHRLRQMWEQHGPASPLCLIEELEPGVTLAEFCVQFLLTHTPQRLRSARE